MYLISGNITSNVTGNLPVITGNGNIGNITSNFRTLVRTQRRVHDAKLRARSGKFSLLFARAYATVNRARRYSSPRWRSYRACKLFNIRLYATLCFNYFW